MFYLVYDTETTDKEPLHNVHIVALGAVLCRYESGSFVRVDTYSTYVFTKRRIAPGASAATGIYQETLEGAPVFKDVAQAFSAWVLGHTRGDKVVLVGYNHLSFDNVILTCELIRHGFDPEEWFEDLNVVLHLDLFPFLTGWCSEFEYTPRLPIKDQSGQVVDHVPKKTLSAMHYFFTGRELSGAHDALVDCQGVIEVMNADRVGGQLNERTWLRRATRAHEKVFKICLQKCKLGHQDALRRNREGVGSYGSQSLMSRLQEARNSVTMEVESDGQTGDDPPRGVKRPREEASSSVGPHEGAEGAPSGKRLRARVQFRHLCLSCFHVCHVPPDQHVCSGL